MSQEAKPKPKRGRRAGGGEEEAWQVARVQLRTWLEEHGEPRRPYLKIVVGASTGQVLRTDITTERPSAPEVLAFLRATMDKPKVGRPRRPRRVVSDDAELVAALAAPLAELGVSGERGETPELAQAVVSLEAYLNRDEPEVPGLLETSGATPEQVGRVFAAAAYFHREAPWRVLSDEHPIAVRVPAAEGEARYAVVMGSGGIEHGLAVYRSIESLAMTYSGIPPELLGDAFDQEALIYGDVTEMPFPDLEAQERYGWEVDGPDAYPIPLIFTREGGIRRPSAEDLRWYEAALRAIPVFVGEHLTVKRGRVRPAEATLTVRLAEGEVAVGLQCPPKVGPIRARRRRVR